MVSAKIVIFPEYLDDILRHFVFNNRINNAVIIRYYVNKIEKDFKGKTKDEIKELLQKSEKSIKEREREFQRRKLCEPVNQEV